MPAPEDLVVIARAVRVGLLGVGAVLVAAGCSSATDGQATPEGASEQGAAVSSTTPALAADVPSGFNPCVDVPMSIIREEDMRPGLGSADYDGSGGRKWRGCRWMVPDSYAVGITTTNLTVDMVRENKNFTVRWEDTIAGRRAVAVHASDEKDPRSRCILNVEMKGGSLEFSMDNPSSRDKTGHMDTCELARGLAEKVVPHVPADA
ncbi:DUF3558 domain-containing protein [Nocardia cyriacigeorgica]|uniref:DUF3558 domain-containing protein n=1 Tax=Nocardia cyriacigeorgica TaxID=135487 RepID=A0A6P1CST9_9NOCA|nr:DUF3558 domain-containing protein [Nocardia cyriacigeorgica]MBF6084495.1 DUF3558 domain-containing protein [Nocardia cyriacigeorgica]MBF6290057.1 DUF3558 domain-containing protein [Nocardia cyriacigeorgica]NEW35640.1 DUF3558 domain-containing protein [Nocardia cyriacigeorgica]